MTRLLGGDEEETIYSVLRSTIRTRSPQYYCLPLVARNSDKSATGLIHNCKHTVPDRLFLSSSHIFKQRVGSAVECIIFAGNNNRNILFVFYPH